MAESLMVRWNMGRCMAMTLVAGVLLVTGCAHVTPQHHRLVSKANMQLHGSTMFEPTSRLLSQFESSSASAVGGQAGGGSCSACGE